MGRSINVKFNITKLELEMALKYAKEFGESEFKTITAEVFNNEGIGNSIHLTTFRDKKGKNITNTDSF